MPSIERETSVDSDRHLRHQHSASSDTTRALVPMWDSSDPDRAPPPLPMNPSSPIVASRPNTSSAIKSVHAALTEKARESAYTINPPLRLPESSPERSLIKGAAHKRMQSLQTTSVRDLSNALESGTTFGSSPRSPEKSPTRQSSPRVSREIEAPKPQEKESSSRAGTPTPSGRETPSGSMAHVRPSLRRPPQSILGENAPPQSATMLALQTIATRDTDTSLANVTNGSTALVRTPQTFDAISSQILSLTSIATNLQREMANLSRRSKDNATDLVSLKEATNARDEDIRKSLRELVLNLSTENNSRSSSSNIYDRGLFLENKSHNHTPPNNRGMKPFALPRIPSPNSFAASLDRDSMTTPASFVHENGATIALLEKILRDMGTKEGQELLVSRLTEVADTIAKEGSTTATKLDELLQYVKSTSSQQGLVARNLDGAGGSRPRKFSFDEPQRLEIEFDTPTRGGPMTQRVGALLASNGNKENTRDQHASRGSEILNEEILKIIRSVKDSVAHGGGLTAEVKALVRELRGEVLVMGREIGRKLDESQKSQNKSAENVEAGTEDVAQIVQEGLDELKQQMDNIIRENRRQSANSVASRNTVDYQEIYSAMRAALNEKDRQKESPPLAKHEIIDAVKEAWENYKPEIEIQQFGLEREELLACLKEGIQEYAPQDNARDAGATREEVLSAVVEGLKHFSPPRVETEASMSREEILDAVRECLEEFEFPAAPAPEPLGPEFTRDDVIGAVREGLQTFDFAAASAETTRETTEAITQDDVLAAVEEGLRTFDFAGALPSTRSVNEGLSRHDVLDALKEGLDSFDFAANAANTTALTRSVDNSLTRDDILTAIEEGLSTFDFPAARSTSRGMDDGLTKHDVLEALKEGLESFDFTSNTANATSLTRAIGDTLTRDDVFDAVQAALRETPPGEGYNQQVVGKLHEILDSMRIEFKAVSDEAKQNVAAHGRDTEQVLDATKDGFDRLRADMEQYVDKATGRAKKEELLDALRDNFDTLRAEMELLLSNGSASSLEAVQGEFEHLRETMATSLVRSGNSPDKEEILDALREGLESIRVEIDRPKAPAESEISNTGEILDALQDGLNGLRADLERIGNRPVDMTVNYEILDTLKAGMESLRSDIDRLREDGYNDRAVAEVNDKAVVTAESLKRTDIESLEVLITQLRIKVEAMESMPTPQPMPGSLSKEDLASVEETLRNVQESVAGLSSKERSVGDEGITRSDFEAIETLLHNTKAKIDEFDPSQNINKDQFDMVEALILEAKEGLTGISVQLEEMVRKEDVNIVEVLVRDIAAALEELKENTAKEEQSSEKVTKTDVEAVEAVCLDMKTALDQMLSTDIATLASKEEVKGLNDLMTEVRVQLDTHAETNAKAFEERQAETVGVGERVSEIKTFLEEFKNAMKAKLEEGSTSVEAMSKLLEGMGDTITKNATVTDDIKALTELLNSEFEKSNAGVVGSKLDADEKFQKTWDNLDIIGTKCEGLDLKLEEKMNDLMLKYDDAQTAAEAKLKAGEDKTTEMEATLLSTKAVADELKYFIETLAATLTESTEKMDEASKTVFSRVDQTFTRIEETHADAKAEHQLTRDQVQKTLTAVEGVHGHVNEYNPKILESIKDVLLIVGQHYEHSKSSNTTIQEKIDGIPPPTVPLDIPNLLEAAAPEKYDDARVHEKLDKLVDHTHVAGKAFAQLDALDKIHKQVLDTAAEVSQFLASQTLRIANDHEDKERAAEAAAIALEKRLAQKESVEATVVGLRDEEERLKDSVAILRAEQEDLAHQKMRLSADVSSLETALRIRREELQAMEARAEGLERRILEGVIDHSRALLVSKSNKGRDAMSRKRVPSRATSTTGSIASSAATSRASYQTQSAISMAMSGNRSIPTMPINTTTAASRRNFSLNQITGNVPNGASAFVKRSHSVKTPGGGVPGLRKSSWGGSLSRHYGELNKENLALKESEEDEFEEKEIAQVDRGDLVSESGTERRESLGTTILTSTGVSESVDDGTEWTGSVVDEDESEAPGSPVEGSHAPLVLYSGSQVA